MNKFVLNVVPNVCGNFESRLIMDSKLNFNP